jgi:hypothetical protein
MLGLSQKTDQIKFNFVDLIILFSYYFFFLFLTASLLGFFNRWLIAMGLIFGLGFTYFFRQKIDFKRNYLYFFIVVPVILLGFVLLRGFFCGDALARWLPLAREIAQTGQIPGFLNNMEFVSRMPLLFLLFAATFSLFNSFNELLVLWLPLFFSAATLILICYWLSKKNLGKKYIVFAAMLFLTNSLVVGAGWNLLQESLILFFFTAFFYYYERFLEDSRSFNLILLILSFVLAVASKFTGLFLIIPLLFLFFKIPDKKKFVSFLFIFSTPILLWFLRNYLIFGNPIFPLLNESFKGKYYSLIKDNVFLHPVPEGWTLFSQIVFSLKRLLLAFPFIILSLWGFLKEKRVSYFLLFFVFFFIEEFVYFSISSGARYYYPFLGLLLIYALVGLSQLKSRIGFTSVFLLSLLGLFLIPFTHSTSSFISTLENRFSLLGSFFGLIYSNHWLFLLILTPIVYFLIAKHKERNYLLILLYALYVLGLSFVANKSWLNVWTSIFLGLAIILILSYFSNIKENYLRKIGIGVVALIIFINSWGMAIIYYWHQGRFSFPAPFVYDSTKKAAQLLDELEGENRDFYVLSTGTAYLIWYKNYRAFNYNVLNFKFNLITKMGYRDDLTLEELRELLTKSKIKYIWDDGGNEYLPEKGRRFFEKIKGIDDFQLIYEGPEGRLVKVY